MRNLLLASFAFLALIIMAGCINEIEVLQQSERDWHLSKLNSEAERNYFDKAFMNNNTHIASHVNPRGSDELVDSFFNALLSLQLSEPFAEDLINLIGYPIWLGAEVHAEDSLHPFISIPTSGLEDSLTQGIIYGMLGSGNWYASFVRRDTLLSYMNTSIPNSINFPAYLLGMIYYDEKIFVRHDTNLTEMYTLVQNGFQGEEGRIIPRACQTVTGEICYNVPCITYSNDKIESRGPSCYTEECEPFTYQIGCYGNAGSGGSDDVGIGIGGGTGGVGTGGSGPPPPPCGATINNLPYLCDDPANQDLVDAYNALLPYLLTTYQAAWILNNASPELINDLLYFMATFSTNTHLSEEILRLYVSYLQHKNVQFDIQEFGELVGPYILELNLWERFWLFENIDSLNDSEVQQFLELLSKVELANNPEIIFAYNNRLTCYDIMENYPDMNLDAVINTVYLDLGVGFQDFIDTYDDFRVSGDPIDGEIPEETENGIDIISSYTPSTWITGTPIGGTLDRNNVEDIISETNGNTKGIMYQLQKKSNTQLFEKMYDLFDIHTFLDLNEAGEEFVDEFKTNTSTNYAHENWDLSNTVREHVNMINFVKDWGALLNARLIVSNGVINGINIQYTSLFPRPQFSGWLNRFNGLGILLNDTEYTTLEYTNYSFNSSTGEWTATLLVNIEDHFGLDKHDVLVFQIWHEGFGAWWYLQHVRGKVPFHTRVRNVYTISGDITP